MDDDQTPNTLHTMRTLVEELHTPTTLEHGEATIALVPSGLKPIDLTELAAKHAPHPVRAKGTSTHHTLASLVAHALRHKAPATVAFCDAQAAAPTLTVVYNYDGAGPDGAPGHRDRRATYAFPLSEPWKAWAAQKGKWLSVADFAALLETRAADVRDPSDPNAPAPLPGMTYATASALLTLAKGLGVRVEQEVKNATSLDDGTSTLLFSEKHSDATGAPLRVPNGFLLGLPVFVGGLPYAVPARLRYRVKERQIVWQVELHDPDACLRAAVEAASTRFATETGLPVFDGTSE